MRITHVIGREIYNSRGLPTLECELILDEQFSVRASVPSGASCSKYEVKALHDHDKRLFGLGVKNAIDNLENIVAPLIIGKEPNFMDVDTQLIEIDGTADKSKLGANTILTTSIALLKAQAQSYNISSYEFLAHICNFNSVSMPYPMFNIINGGAHADTDFNIQEIMITPMGFNSFKEGMEASVEVFYTLKSILQKNGKHSFIGDEGGFCPNLASDIEAFDLIMQAIETAGYSAGEQFKIAIDVAASQLFDAKTNTYKWQKESLSNQELIQHYVDLVAKYPIYSLEDGLHEDDWEGWQQLFATLGSEIQIVGDDIFATNPQRISEGVAATIANAAIIKPNQIGTMTETLQAIILCKEHGLNTVVSHRSGETEDTFIVDLAVGTNAGQLKAGGCLRGERIEKYNQLLRIEEIMHRSLLE